MILPALAELRRGFEEVLDAGGVERERILAFTTPRRLAVLVEGLPEKCPDREELVWGPPVSAAFDAAGRPTKAAEGFARRQGVAPERLEQAENERGRYVVARKVFPGRPVREVLADALPDIIAGIHWPKTMYWSSSRFRFIRPLRWFVLLWDADVVPFTFEGVTAGRTSRGHRLIGPAAVEIPEASAYVETLRAARVLVDVDERRRLIEAGLEEAAGELELVPDPELLETVVHLIEFPAVVRGGFDPVFLRLPREVLVTVMRHHQKYFSLVDAKGALAAAFLAVINNAGDPDGSIREGHEKVLRARLEDGAFFWDADRKVRLEERVPRLADVLFQEKLGSYLEKTQRLEALCRRLDGDEDLVTAAHLCKVDLTTEMVREFPELQGVMGGLYAREEGYGEGVWKAIYEHYRPVSLDDPVPETRNGALLSIADRLDTLAGCFGVGIVPSGSSDPFGLRRQAQGLAEVLRIWRFEYSWDELLEAALAGYPWSGDAGVKERLLDFVTQRVAFVLRRLDLPADVVRAVCAPGIAGTSMEDLEARARGVQRLRHDEDFAALAVAFKRAVNLLARAGEEVPEAPDPGLFREPGERAFHEAVEAWLPRVEAARRARDYNEAVRLIAAIRPAVDRFFDDVMVMVDDAPVRRNRLALLRRVGRTILQVVDPSQLLDRGGEDEDE
ncbi:MAG: glycine--tRNA ligase subunit beta [Acidobacteriota bacterium]